MGFLNWSIIALQCCVRFHEQQSEPAISPPSWTYLSTAYHPTFLGYHSAPSWAPYAVPQVPINYFIHGIYVKINLPVHPTLPFPPCVHISILLLFSHSVMSDSLRPHGLRTSGVPVLCHLWSLLRLMSIESVMPSNHLILCRPLLLLPSIFPSIRVFSNESALRIGWPKYWSFSFSISPYNEYSGLVSFRIDWLELLAVQGTLKSLLQHHS